MYIAGTCICFIVSDPMVDVFSELSSRLHINSFYVTFLLAPLASNATELIAAYNYAKKKSKKSITIALSTLLGAACLNNTFSLGIFLSLIYWKSVPLNYFAEFSAILFVQGCLYYFCQQYKVHTMLHSICILLLFPLSLLVVAVLEYYGWN